MRTVKRVWALPIFCPGDYSDKFVHKYTFLLVFIVGALTSVKHYAGNPIECWTPPTVGVQLENYVKSYCWNSKSFYSASANSAPIVKKDFKPATYRSAPMFLFVSALAFLIPTFMWTTLSSLTSLSVPQFVEAAMDSKLLDAEGKSKCLRGICGRISAKSVGSTFLYMFVKLISVALWLVQIICLKSYLSVDFGYVFRSIMQMMRGLEWEDSPALPREIMCDVEVQLSNNLHRHELQCEVSANVMLQSMLIFLWLWYFIGLLISIISLFYWFLICTFSCFPVEFLRAYLDPLEDGGVSPFALGKFAFQQIGADTVLILRLIQKNAGEVITQELIRFLWDGFAIKTTKQDNGDACDEMTPGLTRRSFTTKV